MGKLALAVALAGSDTSIVTAIEEEFKGFAKLCKQFNSGTSAGAALAGAALASALKNPAAPSVAPVAVGGPAPQVHLLQLTKTAKLVVEGLPPEGPAIVHDKDMKDTFSCAHHVLSELCSDVTKVDFRDDAEWTVMPEIGAAITAAGVENDCYCVAVAPDKSCWGVGIGCGWKGRQPAAKLALALALAMHAGKLDALSGRYPEFGAMCAKAGLVDLGQAAKVPRVG